MDIIALKKYTGVRFPMTMIFIKPLISSAVMGIVAVAVYRGMYFVLGSNGLAAVIAILLAIVVYGLMILRTKAVTRDEVINMPKGNKLVSICDKLKLW